MLWKLPIRVGILIQAVQTVQAIRAAGDIADNVDAGIGLGTLVFILKVL